MELSAGTRQRYAHQKTGIDYDEFSAKIFISYWHKIFEALKPYFRIIKRNNLEKKTC
jgi:hypothetical protein